MRKTISVSALVLALACSAYAGEMQNGSSVPLTQPASVQEQTTTGGWMPNGQPETITQAVLTVLGSVLGVL